MDGNVKFFFTNQSLYLVKSTYLKYFKCQCEKLMDNFIFRSIFNTNLATALGVGQKE